ncbi:MAG TPA: TIM barrel protein [Tepidisphaeraceae bacterium]
MDGKIIGGLVSVTFRKLSCERVVALAAEAGLSAIEWGGDVHVPHGDVERARTTRRICEDAGIRVSGYGSYYRVGAAAELDVRRVIETAEALGTTSIRVWAGGKGSSVATPLERKEIEDDLRRVCGLAAVAGMTIDLEYHGGTLTDSADSTRALLRGIEQPNLRTYWQPRHGDGVESGVSDLHRLGPWLGNLHVFHWWPDPSTRLPLAEGADRWRRYLWAAPGTERFALLEFVRGDDEQQFLRDAATLRSLLAE